MKTVDIDRQNAESQFQEKCIISTEIGEKEKEQWKQSIVHSCTLEDFHVEWVAKCFLLEPQGPTRCGFLLQLVQKRRNNAWFEVVDESFMAHVERSSRCLFISGPRYMVVSEAPSQTRCGKGIFCCCTPSQAIKTHLKMSIRYRSLRCDGWIEWESIKCLLLFQVFWWNNNCYENTQKC